MYQAIWGLEKPPFPSGLDPRLFFEGASHHEALARLRFLLTNHRRLGLLLGEPGTGKSLLLKVFEKQCQQQAIVTARVNLFGITTREFIGQVAEKLGAQVRLEDDTARMFRQLVDQIMENRLQGTSTAVLIDDVHQAGPDLLAQIVRLAQFDATDENPLTIVLASNSQQSSRLGGQLSELADLRIDLVPWDELDTIGYLQLALVEAGSERPLFDDDSLAEIHRLAAGVPRLVNRLADHALMIGADAATEIIDTPTIRAAHESLGPKL